ncbi:hypothetical protein AVEN_239148-1 [Araneus ventricosus]|uniref:Uncharacterized protein n=1 Tax=Araneus ventricosus TaxID=182803 RepID=A0A4Y2H6Y6_ARAVE|nr:hypothetical protein AVEN_239148-1 [Araneus ventricosus]
MNTWIHIKSLTKKGYLPPTLFESTLTGSGITDEDYRHAQTVWNYFNLKNMGEYHDFFVKCDVLQLADVFENYASIIMAWIVCTSSRHPELHGKAV